MVKELFIAIIISTKRREKHKQTEEKDKDKDEKKDNKNDKRKSVVAGLVYIFCAKFSTELKYFACMF